MGGSPPGFHGKAAFWLLPLVKVCPLPFVPKFPNYKLTELLSKSVEGEKQELLPFSVWLTHLFPLPAFLDLVPTPSRALQDWWKPHLSLPVRIKKQGQEGSCEITFRAVQKTTCTANEISQPRRGSGPWARATHRRAGFRGSCGGDTKRLLWWTAAGMKEAFPAWPRFQMSLFKPECYGLAGS